MLTSLWKRFWAFLDDNRNWVGVMFALFAFTYGAMARYAVGKAGPIGDVAWVFGVLALTLAVLSVGCFLKHRWARIGGLGVASAVFLWKGWIFLQSEITFNRLIGVALWAWVWIILAFQWDPAPEEEDAETDDEDEDDDGPMLSLVLLLSEPKYMETPILARLASHAWQRDIRAASKDDDTDGDHEDDGDGWVVGTAETPVYMMMCTVEDDALFFIVHNFPMPYVEDPDAVADEIDENRRARALREHKAWLSVDLMRHPESWGADEAYRWIGKLLADLIDETALAVLCPQTGAIAPVDEGMAERLRGENPLEEFAVSDLVPVVRVDGEDERLKAAVEEARRRFPDFVSAFEQREHGQLFSVKTPVTRGGNTEYIWITVTAIENETIYGELGNDPVDLPGLACGDRVKVDVPEVVDWMYLEDDEMQGGFSVRAIQQIIQSDGEDTL